MTDRQPERNAIAPCGLNCEGCIAFAGGPVQKTARELAELLGPNFGAYAARFEAMDSTFSCWNAFRTFLALLERGDCPGCRHESCALFPTCQVRPCARQKGVTYCAECEEFPCDHTGFPEGLRARWQANNENLRQIGPETYAEEARKKPRYP